MSNQNSVTSSTKDLQPSERRLVTAMRLLGYGRFESLQIRAGELILDPWPITIRTVKFGNATPNQPGDGATGLDLKKQVVELLGLLRSIDSGSIRVLEVRGGLPFCIEIEEPFRSSKSTRI